MGEWTNNERPPRNFSLLLVFPNPSPPQDAFVAPVPRLFAQTDRIALKFVFVLEILFSICICVCVYV